MRHPFAFVLAPLLLLASCSQEAPPPPVQKPIPALTTDQQTQLAEAGDFNRAFDEGPLYALLGAAVQWPRDAFGGATPLVVKEQVDPKTQVRTPVLELMDKPAAHRGEAMLIEGILTVQQQGVPNNLGGMLSRPDSSQWGSTLTYWVIRIGRTEYDPQVMVFFPSDGRPLPNVHPGSRVRVAARFYKVFTAESQELDRKRNPEPVQTGKEEPFVAFVGGAAQITYGGGYVDSPFLKLIVVVVFIAIGFGGVLFIRSYLKSLTRNRTFKSPAERWAERLEREREEGVEDDDDQDLPEDPAEALKKLGGGE